MAMSNREKAAFAALECTIVALREELERSESRRKHEGAAYRMRISAAPRATHVMPSAMQRCKQLAAEGVKCYVRGDSVFDAVTHDAL